MSRTYGHKVKALEDHMCTLDDSVQEAVVECLCSTPRILCRQDMLICSSVTTVV